MKDFTPGIELAGKFYQEAVRPILESDFPEVPYSAALIGSVSEVLGFDTEMSTDHHWGLTEAYQLVAAMHNALEITEPLPTTVRDFFGRPFKVIALQGFAEALCSRITDPKVQRIANRPPIGGIDMISDNTDILSPPHWRPILRDLFA